MCTNKIIIYYIINHSYLKRIRFFHLLDERLRAPGDSVLPGYGTAILRGAHELDSTTLHDDIGGWRKVLYVADCVAVAQKPCLFTVERVDLSATVGKCEMKISSPSIYCVTVCG